MRSVTVIGAGPAGMMAAVSAARAGARVTLMEKNEKLGKKLYVTGKGRCNLTNVCDTEDFISHVVNNPKFLYSAVYSFTSADTCVFFEEAGLRLKTERGMRVFPLSGKSSDVIRTFQRLLNDNNVEIRLNTEVKNLKNIQSDAVIIATGGLSYPATGSTGDGYRFAKELGHDIVETVPSLVALNIREDYSARLEGLSLRNVAISVRDEKDKEVYSDFGEMLFTDRGVSGPVILSASAIICRKLSKTPGQYRLCIDLKPAMDERELNTRILKDFERVKNKHFKNALNRLLPLKLIPVILSLSGIDPDKPVNEVTKTERVGLVRLLKNFSMTIEDGEGFDRAVITSGGVDIRHVNPSTMESKLAPGIYFAGEVLDVDALTGGFNIQIALSTGFLAGKAAAKGE
ncbi:MAG: NAD(P)/FAD-dependent oxidoreductase [Lachnospiraceae bacterium]|jgi:predicted Rossmann fold flavoprotein